MPRRKRRRWKSITRIFASKSKKHEGTPALWAALTLLAFPIILFVADAAGISPLWSFALGVLGSLCVLAAEILIRGRMWIFEDHYVERLHHPRTPIRILFVAAGALLILETALIMTVALNRSADDALLGLVLRKECAATGDQYAQDLCLFLRGQPVPDKQLTDRMTPQEKDPLGFALRSHAAETWFPEEALVTCAYRKIDQLLEGETYVRHASLMLCTAWELDTNQMLHVKTSRAAYVGAHLMKERSGLYTVFAWSDDLYRDAWGEALGPIATRAERKARSLSLLEEFRLALSAETLGRAQAAIQQ